jgi:hypothetical protein
MKKNGIYHGMWTRQREADAARRKLAENLGEDEVGPTPAEKVEA